MTKSKFKITILKLTKFSTRMVTNLLIFATIIPATLPFRQRKSAPGQVLEFYRLAVFKKLTYAL